MPQRAFLYHNFGDGTFTKVTDSTVADDPSDGGFPSWVDYDNDGFMDLFLGKGAFNPVPQINHLYHNDGNANAWLNVKLVGTTSNRSAIGAKVRVKAFYRGESRWPMREISGGDSNENQQSLNAEFGLADATRIEVLRVEWPSGKWQEVPNVSPNQFITMPEVPEPGLALSLVSGMVLLAGLKLRRKRPNEAPSPPRSASRTAFAPPPFASAHARTASLRPASRA